MISPQGTVYLGHVPWNDTYRNVYYEGMMNKSLIISNFMDRQTNNYTYIREDTNIRVPYNADNIYGINYCMYQNDGMWFCCFVKTITYVNNGTSLLHLEEDIWHTWGGAMVLKPCLVERCHVLNDTVGLWRAPEPALNLEPYVLSEQRFLDLDFDAIIVGTNAVPHLKSTAGGDMFSALSENDIDGSDAVSGGLYHRIYSGLKYYGFTGSDIDALNNFLNNINMAGAADSIASMFMVPSSLLAIGDNYEVIMYGSTFPEDTYGAYTVSAPGYTPRNKKCLTYPYCYFKVTDFNGGTLDLKYEDCNNWGDVTLKFEQGLDATASLICTPMNYEGVAINYDKAIVLSQNPQCAWVFQAYQNWMAQNASTNQVKQNINFLDMFVGLGMTVVGGALIASGVGAPAGGVLGELGLTTAGAAGVGLLASGTGKAISAGASEDARRAEIEAQKKVPNHISGMSSSNTMQGLARNMGGYMRIGLHRQSAERLDQFFDVFGYQVDMLMTPILSGRKTWNYVKTVGANMGGNIPADRLGFLNRSLDGGVTFWHTTDVGNYGLDNTL